MTKELFNYKFDDLFNPTLQALHELGGSGVIEEIESKVADILKLSDEQISDLHRGNTTKLSYRLAWARNYLKRFGILENSSRGVWALTGLGQKTKSVDEDVVKRKVRGKSQKEETLIMSNSSSGETEEEEELTTFTWKEKLIEVIQNIEPSAFERLCQRILRELGFQNVEVTGKSNDGGIDGRGLLRLGGVLSFRVIFQAKRYKGSVSPSIVRDFRGAMVGRAERGLIITTGNFTKEARIEANRDGAPNIDLMDGNDLAEKLKELKLGIEVEQVEKVDIKEEWYKNL